MEWKGPQLILPGQRRAECYLRDEHGRVDLKKALVRYVQEHFDSG